jgi:hypothetical protein
LLPAGASPNGAKALRYFQGFASFQEHYPFKLLAVEPKSDDSSLMNKLYFPHQLGTDGAFSIFAAS